MESVILLHMDTHFSLIRVPLLLALFLGVLFGFMDLASSFFFVDLLNFPLYMDCIFTTAASFISPVSGVMAGIMVHVFRALFANDMNSLLFIICSVSIVPLVRMFVNRPAAVAFVPAFAMLVAAITFVISIEGGIIYNYLFNSVNYMETSSTNALVFTFVIYGFPMLFSGILGRIPLTMVDKLFACFAGYWIARFAVHIIPARYKGEI